VCLRRIGGRQKEILARGALAHGFAPQGARAGIAIENPAVEVADESRGRHGFQQRSAQFTARRPLRAGVTLH
jgi:hypothetical protein